MRIERHAVRRSERVHPQAQRPRRRHLRVLLSQRARRGVPRVRERPLPVRGQLLVQPAERLHREVHLAPHLDQRGRVLQQQLRRHATHRADVRRDVLAGDAVTARRAPHQPSPLVRQRARHPVDLQLAREPAASPTRVSTRAFHASSSSNENVLSSESMGARCATGANRSAGTSPTRWVGESGVMSSGNAVLERLELADHLVVLDVGDLGIVEDVIAVAVVVDVLAELLDAELRLSQLAFLGPAHGRAISTPPATPISAPTTTTPPRTPGTCWRYRAPA